MTRPAVVSRDILQRMLDKVQEMRRALTDSSGAAASMGENDRVDIERAIAALDDLERRVRRMLESEAQAEA